MLPELRRLLQDDPEASRRWFRICAAASLCMQGVLIFRRQGVWGGGDLVPHLRIMELLREQPGLHNTYAPAYHVFGALATRLIDLTLYPKLFAGSAAVLLIAGFRFFRSEASGLARARGAGPAPDIVARFCHPPELGP